MADLQEIHDELASELSNKDRSKALRQKIVDETTLITRAENLSVKDPSNIIMRFYYWIVGTPVERMQKKLETETKRLRAHIAALTELKTNANTGAGQLDGIVDLCNQLHKQLTSETDQATTKLTEANDTLEPLDAAETTFVARIGIEQKELDKKKADERRQKEAEKQLARAQKEAQKQRKMAEKKS